MRCTNGTNRSRQGGIALKMQRIFAAGIALALLLAHPSHALAAQNAKTQVMILGVAHLVARRDVHNSVFEDSPLSEKRQTQVADVVRLLAQFHPTKVLVEKAMGDPKVVAQYQAYRGGTFTLGADEVYQFGFRLAAAAGNATIYPIDTFGPDTPDDPKIDAYLKAHFTTVDDPVEAKYEARQDTIERTGTYLDLLQYLNTDEAIRANASWYSIFDGMGRDADDAGSSYVSQWYTRNCYIFSNILSVIKPRDRVVVMMGQGHEYLLREFVRLNPTLADVDPLEYLRQDQRASRGL